MPHYGPPGPVDNNTNSLRRLYYHRGRNRGRTIAGRNRFHKVKAPRGAPGSDEAILFAGNILYDPGFELFVQNAAPTFLKPGWEEWTGASSYILPRFDINSPTGQRWPNGDFVDRKDIAQWAQFTEPYELASNVRDASVWFVTRREAGAGLGHTTQWGPNLGIWMARWYDWTSSANFPFGNSVPGGLIIQGPGMPAGYSGRTEPGALITWGLYAWLADGSEETQTMDLAVQFFTQAGNPIITVQNAFTLNTTKTFSSISSNSPGGSYFIRAFVTFRPASTARARETILAIDSGLLGVE